MNEILSIFFFLGSFLVLFFWAIVPLLKQMDGDAPVLPKLAPQPKREPKVPADVPFVYAGSMRINPPRGGGCRHGYCYACGGEIALLVRSIPNKDPTLPRGDTYWFCSSFCYNRILKDFVPPDYRYDTAKESFDIHAAIKYPSEIPSSDVERVYRELDRDFPVWKQTWEQKKQSYFGAAEPMLLDHLRQVESEEPGHLLRLEQEKRATYKYPDPPARWQPIPNPPVVHSIKRPSPDRCAKCGTPHKTSDAILVQDTPYWFCSHDCSHDATEDFVAKRWTRNGFDDPDFLAWYEALKERDMLPEPNELGEQWSFHWNVAYENARAVLEERLRAEARKQEAEEAEKEEEMQDRQWEKDYIAAEKEHEQFLEREAYEQALLFKPIPDHLRIHTGIIAKTGWGKTQLLQTLILWELKKPDPPSLIVLDSTGQMVDLIQRLALFNDRLRDRILIVDPAHSPSLNMFDLSSPRFETYTREQKEDIQNEIVNLFNYVFSSEDYKLTGQMGIGFAYAVRLILSRPNSTIRDLRRLLEEDCKRCEQSAYASAIAELDEDAQDFFRSHFYSDELKKTRAAIARRLQLLLSIPAFARMFITSRNALDLYGETQDKRSIILVNTNERLLKEGGYILFGRYIVARTMAAILERASIPRDQRTITHLIIDEGSPYMDETFDTLLTRVRQYGLKVTIAFQHFQQLTDKLKNSVAGQTSVKYAGGLSYQDARFLANEMRCEPDFLTGLKTDISHPPKWTQFAAYADNWNDNHSMLFSLPFFTMEREPKMTSDQHTALLARNRQRVAPAPQVIQKPQPTITSQTKEHPSAPEQPKPLRESGTQTQPPAKSPPTDPHTGDHTEPASKWGEQ